MKSFPALLTLVAAGAIGCASAPPREPPDDVITGRVYTNPVVVGTFAAPSELERVLPTALARYGYSIAKAQQPTANHLQFVTEWQTHEAARSRLIVDARRRGPRYALSIYAITYLQDEAGGWYEARTPDQLRTHLRELGRQLALEMR